MINSGLLATPRGNFHLFFYYYYFDSRGKGSEKMPFGEVLLNIPARTDEKTRHHLTSNPLLASMDLPQLVTQHTHTHTFSLCV